MKNWNKADKLLAVVTMFFIIALFLKLQYPGNLYIKGFLFCTEAALVGGVADWFAVTALFRKPLGFPYHTAILSRKRQAFTNSCVNMVQQEFFSKKKLLFRIRKLNLLQLFVEWLEKNQMKEFLAGIILQYLENALKQVDIQKTVDIVEAEIKKKLSGVPQEKIYVDLKNWFVEKEKNEELFSYLIEEIRRKVSQEETKATIQESIQNYSEEKNKNIFVAFLTTAAQMSNVLNFSEAAFVLQQQILNLTTDLQQKDNPLRRQLLDQIYATINRTIKDESWQALVRKWQSEIVESVMIKEQLSECLKLVLQYLNRQNEAGLSGNVVALQTPVAHIILAGIDRGLVLLKTDEKIQHTIYQFLYDMMGRSVLQAQLMTGAIVKEALCAMSDAQMNQLVYSKVETDLLWIRMNGSIVGALIGLILFLILQVWS